MLPHCCPEKLVVWYAMAKETLTDRRIKSLKVAPVGKRYDVMDSIVPGFGVRVTDKGNRSFFLLTRYPGSNNPTRRTIGRYGKVTLEQARNKAREWLEQVLSGIDPAIAIEHQAEEERRKRDTTAHSGRSAHSFRQHPPGCTGVSAHLW